MTYKVQWEQDVEAETLIDAIQLARRLSIKNNNYTVNGNQVRLSLSNIKLSQREKETMQLIAQSYSNKEIGAALGVQPRTVKAFVTGILNKTGFKNRTQIAVNVMTDEMQEEMHALKLKQ